MLCPLLREIHRDLHRLSGRSPRMSPAISTTNGTSSVRDRTTVRIRTDHLRGRVCRATGRWNNSQHYRILPVGVSSSISCIRSLYFFHHSLFFIFHFFIVFVGLSISTLYLMKRVLWSDCFLPTALRYPASLTMFSSIRCVFALSIST